MADYQDERFLGSVDSQAWANPAHQAADWCFSPDGTEIWQVFEQIWVGEFPAGSEANAPRLVRFSWPGLQEIDSFVFDWNQGGTGEFYAPWSYWRVEGGNTFTAYDDDTVIVVRARDVSTAFNAPVRIYIDLWTFGDSVGTNIATLEPALSSDGSGFSPVGFAWDIDRAKGLLFTRDDGSLELEIWEVSGNSISHLSGGYERFGTGGSPVAAVSDDGKIYYVFGLPGDNQFLRRVGVYDVDAETIVDESATAQSVQMSPGLSHVGDLPLGDGVHFYRADLGGTFGFDLGSVDSVGSGARRTVDQRPFSAPFWQTNKEHSIGGALQSGGSSPGDPLDWYEMYPPAEEIDNGPWTGFIGA